MKRFRFLTAHMKEGSRCFERASPGGHEHVALAGRAAALSATYNAGLTAALTEVVVGCLEARAEEAMWQHVPRGSERLAVHELLMSAP